jgi:hypothetical protein
MAKAAKKSAATAAEPYSSLVGELRQLKPQGADGFEGYVRDLLGSLCGRTLRLMKSGPQTGKDVLSDTEYSALGIAIEAKRFGDKTEARPSVSLPQPPSRRLLRSWSPRTCRCWRQG